MPHSSGSHMDIGTSNEVAAFWLLRAELNGTEQIGYPMGWSVVEVDWAECLCVRPELS